MWICSTLPDMGEENSPRRGRIDLMVSAPLGTLLTAMVTPFAADGSVNLEAARRLARHLVDTGSDGIVVAGTTGEGPTVSDREKLDLIEAVVSEVGGRATVVANTGSYDTHHSVALTTLRAARWASTASWSSRRTTTSRRRRASSPTSRRSPTPPRAGR